MLHLLIFQTDYL